MSRKKTDEERRKIRVDKAKRLKMNQMKRFLFIGVLLVCFIGYAGRNTYIDWKLESKLKAEGIMVLGKVNGVFKKRRSQRVYYEFKVDNRIYKGQSNELSDYKKSRKGSSIRVIYLPSNPNINKSHDDLYGG